MKSPQDLLDLQDEMLDPLKDPLQAPLGIRTPQEGERIPSLRPRTRRGLLQDLRGAQSVWRSCNGIPGVLCLCLKAGVYALNTCVRRLSVSCGVIYMYVVLSGG